MIFSLVSGQMNALYGHVPCEPASRRSAMKEFTIKYTKSKTESLDDPFALLTFVVYNEKELEEVIKNIETHFDGIIIETGGNAIERQRKKGRK